MVNKNIWLHFEKLGRVIGFQQNRVKCKYCNYELCEIATRCEAHFKKCKDVPTHILHTGAVAPELTTRCASAKLLLTVYIIYMYLLG